MPLPTSGIISSSANHRKQNLHACATAESSDPCTHALSTHVTTFAKNEPNEHSQNTRVSTPTCSRKWTRSTKEGFAQSGNVRRTNLQCLEWNRCSACCQRTGILSWKMTQCDTSTTASLVAQLHCLNVQLACHRVLAKGTMFEGTYQDNGGRSSFGPGTQLVQVNLNCVQPPSCTRDRGVGNQSQPLRKTRPSWHSSLPRRRGDCARRIFDPMTIEFPRVWALSPVPQHTPITRTQQNRQPLKHTWTRFSIENVVFFGRISHRLT